MSSLRRLKRREPWLYAFFRFLRVMAVAGLLVIAWLIFRFG